MTHGILPHTRLGAGAPLVVVPGLSARSGVPARLRRWERRREIRCLAGSRDVWSIRRRIGLEPGITVEQLAAEYATTLRQLFDEPVDVVGVSTGGSVALQLAADHPDLVRRLVLVSAAHRLSDEGRDTQRRVAELLRDNQPRRAASVFLGATAARWPIRRGLALLGLVVPRLVVGHDDADLLATLDAEDSFDLTSRLSTIDTRTLITGGGRDRFYGEEMARTRAGMPLARLELSPRDGHMGSLSNRRIARRVLRFLDGETTEAARPAAPR
jgi:pimeloyl-ACP methyl ester carboxylesterase